MFFLSLSTRLSEIKIGNVLWCFYFDIYILFTWYCWWYGWTATDICVWLICEITQASHGIASFIVLNVNKTAYMQKIPRHTYIFIFWSSHLPFEFTYNLSPLLCFIAFIYFFAIGNYILKNPNLHSALLSGSRIHIAHINISQWKLKFVEFTEKQLTWKILCIQKLQSSSIECS